MLSSSVMIKFPLLVEKKKNCQGQFSSTGDHCSVFIQADVLEYYDRTVSSPSGSFYIPAVLRVKSLWFV